VSSLKARVGSGETDMEDFEDDISALDVRVSDNQDDISVLDMIASANMMSINMNNEMT
jgi:hypothetical protein